MKKAIALLLAVLLIMPLCFAAPAYAEADPTFFVSSCYVLPGGAADVDVIIKNSPGIASAKLTVFFDGDLTLESVTFNEALGETCERSLRLQSPLILNWISLENVEGDLLFATLHFTVSQDASLGKREIFLNFDPEDVCDVDEESVEFCTVPGGVTVSNCLHTHTEIRNACEPGITTAGYTGDVYCFDCGEKLTDGEYIYVTGDANADGTVDIKDVVRIAKYLRDDSVWISPYADTDSDAVITYGDVMGLCDILLS